MVWLIIITIIQTFIKQSTLFLIFFDFFYIIRIFKGIFQITCLTDFSDLLNKKAKSDKTNDFFIVKKVRIVM